MRFIQPKKMELSVVWGGYSVVWMPAFLGYLPWSWPCSSRGLHVPMSGVIFIKRISVPLRGTSARWIFLRGRRGFGGSGMGRGRALLPPPSSFFSYSRSSRCGGVSPSLPGRGLLGSVS